MSISLGALLVGTASVGVVWLLCSVLPFALRAIWVIAVAFVFAYSLYWLPVWLGSYATHYRIPRDEYSAWADLFVGTWFFAGFFPSALLVLILEKRRARRQ